MPIKTQQHVKAVTPKALRMLHQPVPESLLKAAGMLRRHRKALERHIRRVRLEWERSA